MIELLDRRIKSEGLTNVTTVLGGMDDPKLPPTSIDLAIMVDVYHELQQPQMFLQRLKETLQARRPAGAARVPQGGSEGADPRGAQDERGRSEAGDGGRGFVLDKVIDVLPWQHIIVLSVK